MRPKPVVLVVLDGWGVGEDSADNAVFQGKTPNFDGWMQTRPHALVETSGVHVGLPSGQMGNSEVGHTNLGAGRIVYQDFTRINKAIADGEFLKNRPLLQAVDSAIAKEGAVHIMGLLSPGGVHSHTDHLLAAVVVAKNAGVKNIYIHGILDGRDTPPRSAIEFVGDFIAGLDKIGAGRIVSLSGRYYAMDRDNRWDRVQKAYDLYTLGEGEQGDDPILAIKEAYANDINDEFMLPTQIGPKSSNAIRIESGDAIIMMNFRADRVREISHAFLDPATGGDSFTGFTRRAQPELSAYFCLTQYDDALKNVLIGYPPEQPKHILGEEVSRLGLTQLRGAETEKYAHVTYFFNGGLEEPFPGEERLLVASPNVATYDLQPQMSAVELTDQILAKIDANQYDLVVMNYANADMVGHTGKLDAAITAVETVDSCLGRLAEHILAMGGELLITADHGNADMMLKAATGQPHTAHTNNPAPLIYLGRKAELQNGSLCDVAPTLLTIMSIEQPAQMSGRSLLRFV
ncbi:MAG: 2,3-bisphosphoglycerate-independent phosphoglycerate mutase [Magnetococcales bacterium]|nr:2,3-bisphosphoglycerate-independent phosphoglycerate mutase [Magnetococcales bacterium]